MAVYKFDYCCMGRLFGMLQYGLIQQTKRRLDGSLDQSINQSINQSTVFYFTAVARAITTERGTQHNCPIDNFTIKRKLNTYNK